jgi:hypothetical protein
MKVKELLDTITDNEKKITFITAKRVDNITWLNGDETKYDNKEINRVNYKANGTLELTVA